MDRDRRPNMHTIDRLNAGLETLRGRGVRVRYLQDAPVTYGMWRIGGEQVLFLDEASTAAEQLPVVAAAVLQLLDHAANRPAPAGSERLKPFEART